MRQAYVTLLSSENYLEAVLVLNRSLRATNSDFPLVCGMTDTIQNPTVKRILYEEGIIVENIPSLEYNESTKKKYFNYPVLNTASKINLFSLKNYDKLVYIDADTMMLKNSDSLFNYPDGAMIKDEEYGFSGAFVFCPRNHKEEFYKCIITHCDCFDGDLLGNLWVMTRNDPDYQIPAEFCTNFNNSNRDYEGIFIVHFCNETKPWLNPEEFSQDNPVIQRYNNYLREIRYKYGL